MEKKPASKILREVAKKEKEKQLNKNEYVSEDEGYSVTHPNAISDGDKKGKGGEGKKAGSSVDINKRKQLSSKNMYTESNRYKNPEIE